MKRMPGQLLHVRNYLKITFGLCTPLFNILVRLQQLNLFRNKTLEGNVNSSQIIIPWRLLSLVPLKVYNHVSIFIKLIKRVWFRRIKIKKICVRIFRSSEFLFCLVFFFKTSFVLLSINKSFWVGKIRYE